MRNRSSCADQQHGKRRHDHLGRQDERCEMRSDAKRAVELGMRMTCILSCVDHVGRCGVSVGRGRVI